MTKILPAAVAMVVGAMAIGLSGGVASAQSVPGGAPQVVGTTPPADANGAPPQWAMPPAISTSNAESKTPAAPVAGANSFTESEARSRLAAYGYTNIAGLRKDAQSIWRGTATKNGRSVKVALDYQGNIVAQ